MLSGPNRCRKTAEEGERVVCLWELLFRGVDLTARARPRRGCFGGRLWCHLGAAQASPVVTTWEGSRAAGQSVDSACGFNGATGGCHEHLGMGAANAHRWVKRPCVQPSAGDDGPHDLYRYFGRVTSSPGEASRLRPDDGASTWSAMSSERTWSATDSGREWIHAGKALVRKEGSPSALKAFLRTARARTRRAGTTPSRWPWTSSHRPVLRAGPGTAATVRQRSRCHSPSRAAGSTRASRKDVKWFWCQPCWTRAS